MANTLQIKRRTSAGVPSGLAAGELAVNLSDSKLYVGNAAANGVIHLNPSVSTSYLPLAGGTLSGALTISTSTNKILRLNPTISSGGSLTSIAFQRGGTDKWRVFQYEADTKLSFYNDISSLHQFALNSDGSCTFGGAITATGTGHLFGKLNVGSVNNSFDFYNNGTSYFNGAVTVDDTLTLSGDLELADDDRISIGTGGDLIIKHDGSNSLIQDQGTGGLKIEVAGTADNGFYKYGSSEKLATFEPDGPVKLYHNNSLKLETLTTGIKVTGIVNADTLNNAANSANIIYRSGSSTIVGNNASALVVLDGGNTGLGTTSASSLLHLYSSAPVLTIQDGGTWGTNATGYIELKDSGSTISMIGVTGDAGHLDILHKKAGSIRMFTDDAERLTISSAGATTIKSGGNSSYPFAVISSLDSDKIFGVYQDADGDGAAYVLDKNNSSKVGLSSNGNSWFTGGNLGLGTVSPTSLLHLHNSATSGNTQLHIHNDKTGDAAVLKLEGKRTGGSDAGQVLFANNSNSIAMIRSHSSGDDGDLKFYTSPSGSGSSLTERLAISSAGHLSITSTDAAAQLTITPTGTNANARINIIPPGSGRAIFQYGGTEKISFDATDIVLSNNLQVGNSVNGETKLVTFNSEGGAEVGLTVKSRTNRAKLRVADNDTSAYIVAENSVLGFGAAAQASANNFNILSSGFAALGTTAPSQLLHLAKSNSNGLGPVLMLDNTAGGTTDSSAITFASFGNSYHRASITCLTGADPYHGELIFSTGKGAMSALTERMRISSLGVNIPSVRGVVKTYSTTNRISNGDFSSTSNWTLGSGWVLGSGVATFNTTSGSNQLTQQSIFTAADKGKTFKLTFTVGGSGVAKIWIGNMAGSSGYVYSGYTDHNPGTYTVEIVVTDTSLAFWASDSGSSFNLDKISCYEQLAKLGDVNEFSNRIVLQGTDGADGVVIKGGENDNLSPRLFLETGTSGQGVSIMNESGAMQFRTAATSEHTAGGVSGSASGTKRAIISSSALYPNDPGYGLGLSNKRWLIYGTAGDFSGSVTADGGFITERADNNNFITMTATGNETWTISGRSGSDPNDYLDIGTSAGKLSIHESGRLEALNDTDSYHVLGRAKVGYIGHSDYAGFSHIDAGGTGNYALIQSSAGSTYLNAANNQNLYFLNNNSVKMILDTSGDFGINCVPAVRLDVLENEADWAARIKNTHTNGYGLSIDCSANSGTTVYALATYTGAGTGFFVRNNGNCSIGNSAPAKSLHISAADGNHLMLHYSGSGHSSGAVRQFFQRSTGTEASPTGTSDGDIIGTTSYVAYAPSGSSYRNSAAITVTRHGAANTVSAPAKIAFATPGTADDTLVDRLTILPGGNVEIPTGDLTTGSTANNAPLFQNIVKSGTVIARLTANRAGGDAVVGTNSSHNFLIQRAGTTRMTISSSTTSIASNTEVYGYLFVDGATDLTKLQIDNSSGHVRNIDFTRNATGNSNATARIQVLEPGATHTGSIGFWTSNASGGPNLVEAMRINESQHVSVNSTDLSGYGHFGVAQPAGTNTDGIAVVNGTNSFRLYVDDSGMRRLNAGSTSVVEFNSSSFNVYKPLTVGANGSGHDVRFWADNGKFWEWDESMELTRANDNVKSVWGSGDDLQIFHDGSNTYMQQGTNAGNLNFSYKGGQKFSAIFKKDGTGNNGAVELFYDGSKKFETTSAGATITGSLGVGTVSPTSLLHVTGDLGNSAFLAYLYNSGTQSEDNGLNVQIASSGTSAMGLRVNTGGDASALIVTGAGKTGLGKSPSQIAEKFTVGNGNIQLDNGYGLYWNNANTRIIGTHGGGYIQADVLGTSGVLRMEVGGVKIGRPGTSFSDPMTHTLRGYSVQYDSGGSGARLSSQGFLVWNTGASWTGNERMWAFTNAYKISAGKGYFALLRGDNNTRVPTLGDAGTEGTGTTAVQYWDKDGHSTLHGKLSFNRNPSTNRATVLDILDPTDGGISWSTFLRVGRRGGATSNELELKSLHDGSDEVDGFAVFLHDTECLAVDNSKRLFLNALPPDTYAESTADDFVLGHTGGHAGMTIRSGTSHTGSIYFGDGVNGNQKYRGYIEYNHDNELLTFGTSAIGRLKISSGGVGIGIVPSNTALDVQQGSGNIFRCKGDSGNTRFAVGASGACTIEANTGNYPLHITNADSGDLGLKVEGRTHLTNLGVNVAADASDAFLIKSTGDGTNVLNMKDSAGDAMFNVRQSGNDCLIRAYKDGGTQKVQIHTDGSSWFTGGQVGIGTSAPFTEGLEVAFPSADTSFNLNDQSDSILVLRNSDSGSINTGRFCAIQMKINSSSAAAEGTIRTEFAGDGDADLIFSTTKGGTGYDRMTLDEDGHLSLSGNLTLNSRITFSGGSNQYLEIGTDAIALKSSSGSVLWNSASSGSGSGTVSSSSVTTSTTNGNIAVYTASTTVKQAPRLFYNGSDHSLTVNKTSPGDENLHVVGDAQITTRLGVGTSPNSSYAIFASGNMYINGDVGGISKSFKINHPTKTGHKLRHSSLEGPEIGVYQRGEVQGDTIDLPDYWAGLVRDGTVTVQLTPKGSFQQLYVISASNVEVKIGEANGADIDCYYTIYGERADVERYDVEYEGQI